tara:strand:+ start:1019 stop:3271 length:2253 start_codon:yes stop_codon:yes gene_type:complete
MIFIRFMKLFLIFFFLISIFCHTAYSDIIKKIEIIGNERIPNETILMFSDIKINDTISKEKLNLILYNLYESNFFENVKVDFNESSLKIFVVELPLIKDIKFNGIKAKKIREQIIKSTSLKPRSSYNETMLYKDSESILNTLRKLGYYFSKIDTYVEDLGDNSVNIINEIDLGKKAKIKKINFIGNKVFKDRKLRNVIISEEYKFWKFISGKKYLNDDLINFDSRLLKNFYLNQGYYDAEINSSFAKLIADDEFELIYNINAKQKFYFGKLKLSLPNDFQPENYDIINSFFKDLEGQKYSLNSVNSILDRIDQITTSDEFKTINAFVEEDILENKINLNFIINEAEKYIVEKINILGNNITRENVIRNQLELDEGDPYNEILKNKSLNNIKGLNFFKNVSTEIVDGEDNKSKIINIKVEEKPTGEIMAGAGFGTSGSTFTFGVKENNYLGKGLGVDANATVSPETFKGKLSIINPNYKNSDKMVFANIQSLEMDRTKNFGYKSNKSGFELGTQFEYLRQLNLGLSTRLFYEKIETDSTASTRQKKQEGDYLDSFAKFSFDYDKRNQKYRASDGFRSIYSLDLPLISKTNTLTNTYNYKFYSELYENNLSSLSIFLQSANSITGEDVKLSERLSIPSSRLRGFESGKVGPKDGNDFVGGNYVATMNFTSTLPKILEDNQDVDILFFIDAANIWGVDYDSSIDNSSKLRSSIGLAVDWFTAIGPLNFSLTETLTKNDTDVTESFRFNIGTSF